MQYVLLPQLTGLKSSPVPTHSVIFLLSYNTMLEQLVKINFVILS